MSYSGLTTCQKAVLLLILFCLVFCPILTVSSQFSTIAKVEPSTVSTLLGEYFTVTINLANVQNLYGLELILKWNPAVLRATNVDIRLGVETFSDGILHESTYSPPIFIAENNLTQTKGEYRLAATSMAPASSFSGSGNIVRITFEPTSLGDSALDLESQLFDYPPIDRDPRTSFPIDHATQDSLVTVKESTITPSPAPTPTPTPTPPNMGPTSPPNYEPLLTSEQLGIIVSVIIAAAVIGVGLLLYLKRRKR